MEPSPAPLTPLGARTPMAHPGLYAVIAALSLIIIAGTVWVFVSYDVFPDSPPATPTPSVTPTAPSNDASDYLNMDYGLRVSLPAEWRGFGITMFEWTAYDISASGVEQEVATGPKIHIVHPSVAGGNPHQEIPVMVFTIEQWRHVGGQDGDWSVSAAPIPPTELARNNQYVFALPARYNFGALPGWEEVDELIRTGAVSSFEL